MVRMLELIRDGKAPESIVRRAARGELALPVAEAIEILTVLLDDDEFGDPAEQTLRGWDEPSMIAIASDPQTPVPVLRSLLWNQTGRPAVIAALCDNPALSMQELVTAADGGGPEMREAMMRRSLQVLGPAEPIPATLPAEAEAAAETMANPGEATESHLQEAPPQHPHEHELVDEEDRPFELVTDAESEADPLAQLLQRAKHGGPAVKPEEEEKLSLLQKLARMRVGDRIKLATRGGREERMVLIRDRSKLVSLAVLTSPKVDPTEMESYAAMKNVQEAVLRAIATNRKNLKSYGVVRALVSNPKAPLDVSLPLMAHLLAKDLRLLSMNKNVNETIRKRAVRMFKEKTEKKKEG